MLPTSSSYKINHKNKCAFGLNIVNRISHVHPKDLNVICESTKQHSSNSSKTKIELNNNNNIKKYDRRNLLLSTGLIGYFMSEEASHAASFLKSSGGKGVLAEEEEVLYQLRLQKEGAARQEIQKEIINTQDGRLCATPFGVDIVGITELVALIGAIVGGIAARQRKIELQRLNEQLRKINLSLRQNARSGIVYAPGLTYAPPADKKITSPSDTNDIDTDIMNVGGAAMAAAQSIQPMALISVDEDALTLEQKTCRDALKTGKKLLKEKNGSGAMVRFEKALMLSRGMSDKIQERRAMRGLAASARLLGQNRTAIKHLHSVLKISEQIEDHVGDADAYGTIADIYTEMGEFEKAAENYDIYISKMNREGPV